VAKTRDANPTAAYTTEFHHEFRAETGRLLRRRFFWFTAVVGLFGVVAFSAGLVIALFAGAEVQGEVDGVGPIAALKDVRFWVFSLAWLALYAGCFLFVLRQRPRDDLVLRLSIWLVMADAMLNIAMDLVGFEKADSYQGFFVTHLLACSFLPWTAWQALQPALVVLPAAAVATLLIKPLWGDAPGADAVLMAALSPLLAAPGMVWCLLRHSKRTQDFKLRFMSSRYTEMRRELVDARRIHESLFPEGIEIGELRFTFEYEPMRQIGGDFLFAHRIKRGDGALDDGPLSVVLLDVTGHGIPAALTVNRLHGELERVYAENPEVGPGEVLGLLNRYVHLTLASHSIYVTALCLRVNTEASTLEFASGGHPPAFLRAVDGTVEELVSTSFVLGAAAYADYDPAPRTLRFGPGDTVLAYTDGAIEARNETGQMIRIDGLRRMVASANGIPPTKWPAAFRHEVTQFRGGPAEDDTLLFVVHRVVGSRVPAGAPETVGAGEAR
jgi:sigma-B regulation protein RsbU (phosphoserine phosphatase)